MFVLVNVQKVDLAQSNLYAKAKKKTDFGISLGKLSSYKKIEKQKNIRPSPPKTEINTTFIYFPPFTSATAAVVNNDKCINDNLSTPAPLTRRPITLHRSTAHA